MIQTINIKTNEMPHIFEVADPEIELQLGSIENGFWGENISMVSAIVGKNGTGKSSILRYIKQYCDENLDNNSRPKAVYFSPHLDYRDNYNFDVEANDISLDNILRRDLEYIFDDEKESGENGWKLNPKKDLKYLNTARQMDFLSSTICEEHPIFSGIFEGLKFGIGNIVLRGSSQREISTETFYNTPSAFRQTIEDILGKCKSELNNWEQVLKRNNGKIINQHEVNVYIFKRNLIISFLSVVVPFMELKNDYLSNGVLKKYSHLTAIDLLRSFVGNAKIDFQNGLSKKIKLVFNPQVMELFDFIYKLVDDIQDEKLIQNKSFNTSYDNLEKIKSLQKEIINYLTENYYYEKTKMNWFLGIESTNRDLSSGENALLNLYSVLYEYIQKIDKKNIPNEYILLLDEADLGYHPEWKKRFVNSIVKSLPLFFKFPNHQAKIQIIFTTHDPLTLSDIPRKNVVFLNRNSEGQTIISIENKETFGANIHDLLADSFFISDGLMGDFAKEKIDRTILWLRYKLLDKEIASFNDEKSDLKNQKMVERSEIISQNNWVLKSPKESHKEIIDIIDEPLLRFKMSEMYYQIFSNEIDKDEAKKRIIDIALRSGLNINFEKS